MKLVFWGIIVHLIFLASVFDVYFNSPVIQGITPYYPTFEPAAKRLVLFVADGLRASTLFNNGMNEAPYLRHLVKTSGSWGVSHTRVPTESRPGHVALIAGLYEDPSAVTKGWKENPVEFDSVFNRSYHTWSWGSADILPMFAKGEAAGRVTTRCYPKSMEEFSGDGSNEKLDTWVLEHFASFFKTAENIDELHKDSIIFFLHFLGIDTAGHATKPHSRQYLDNIKLVDSGIKMVERIVNEFYENDGKTAFIFTSDHGMTDWGSHGAGLPDETETPIIVWGAGLRGPLAANPSNPINARNPEWRLENYERSDLEQADIAALMSALLAIPTPTNNVGVLPRSLLSNNQSWIVEAMMSNAQQLLLQFRRARERVHERLLPVFLTPFPLVSDLNLSIVQDMLVDSELDSAAQNIERIENLTLEGIQYYQDYFGPGIKWAITLAHILWFLYLIKNLPAMSVYRRKQSKLVLQLVFVTVIIVTILLVTVQRLPVQFVIYYCLPTTLIWILCTDINSWFDKVVPFLKNYSLHLLASMTAMLTAVSLMVLTFYYRASLSVGLALLACWPSVEMYYKSKVDAELNVLWIGSCVVLSVFPLLPVVGREANYSLVVVSGIATVFFESIAIFILNKYEHKDLSRRDWMVFISQIIVTVAAACTVYSTAANFDAGHGLLLHTQILAWLILATSIVLPVFTGSNVWTRLLSVWFSLATMLLLLSVRHETLFFLSLLSVLTIHPVIELQISQRRDTSYEPMEKNTGFRNYVIVIADLRRACIYLFLTILAFFGLGNIASLNSFDPSWVRCFVTTFSPHLMAALILLKTVVPFLAVACSAFLISNVTKHPTEWLLVLGLCDMMALPFFHLIVTRGSWLDVGQSLSHFVIAHACILFLLVLHWAAKHWLSVTVMNDCNLKHLPSLETGLSKVHGE